MGAEVDESLLRALAEARALGFLGPGPVEDHVRHAEAFLDLWPATDGAAIDVGSGGGVPGLVLACRLPRWDFVLLDGQRRRTSFLARAVAAIPTLAGRVRVVRGSTEVLGAGPPHAAAFDVATARGFGTPSYTLDQAGQFVRPGGLLVVADPPDGSSRWASELTDPAGFDVAASTSGVSLTALRRRFT